MVGGRASFEWEVDVQELFGERYPQMVNSGLPVEDVDALRLAITDMWADCPGGWVYEWSQLAARYAGCGKHQLAVLAYGWTKFPTLANESKRNALVQQLKQYQLAAPSFKVAFERCVIDVPHLGGTTAVPVHLLTPPGFSSDAPVLLASGGVDTWKMDMHQIFEIFALRTGMRVVTFDIAGTGESEVPMSANGGAEMVRGLIAAARSLGNGYVIHLGLSMGGYFSARSGLTGEVDAAVDWGGPVEHAFADGRDFAFGMNGIIGNALGFDHGPTKEELARLWPSFNLRHLLDRNDNAPMLVINGADDVHVPQHDTLVFRGRRNTEVRLISGTGHCATSKMPEVVQHIVEWLNRKPWEQPSNK
ncbi:alpha/beta-hydrolase [Ramicandelaber brevisporus]|nr:alpha/beta-hydrolase [Ramicandelaber brevisporus]